MQGPGSNKEVTAKGRRLHIDLTFQVVLNDVERTSTPRSTDILIGTEKPINGEAEFTYSWHCPGLGSSPVSAVSIDGVWGLGR